MKAKEDWIGSQREEIKTCLNKNNCKIAYQLVKDLTPEKQGRPSTIQDKFVKCLTEGQLAALPELQNYQPYQSFEQSHAESHFE